MLNYHFNKEDLHECAKQLWEFLEPKLDHLDDSEKTTIQLAFDQMLISHGEMRRASGDFYIVHPVRVCAILADIGLDVNTLVASLLHDVPEDTGTTLKQLLNDFGPEIVYLLEGVTKLSTIKYQGIQRYAENLRKMFIAISRDLRIVFIKLADRLDNLRTLKYLPEHKQYRIALESIEIYAPIAERLGISHFRGEIEDAAFPYVHPEEYKQFIQMSEIEIQKRIRVTEKIVKKTKQILTDSGIPFLNVLGRAKKYYSIYKKMQRKGSLENIYDLIALRVITDTVENCYNILALLHQHFEPLPNRVKDYINLPKPNGYRSIHTTVQDPQTGQIFEFQIRTQLMHEYAEYGMAVHWTHKDKTELGEYAVIPPERLKWIDELIALGQEKMSEEEYLKNVRLDLFQDRIFVLTPAGDAINLPQGATPLDFAFKIHADIAYHAVMAKVNGMPYKLSDPLNNGDTVEIITDKKQTPKRDWLNWVKTQHAQKHIRNFLKKQDKLEASKGSSGKT